MKKNTRSSLGPRKGHGRGTLPKRAVKTDISISKTSPLSPPATSPGTSMEPAESCKQENMTDRETESIRLAPEADLEEVPNIHIDYASSMPESPVYMKSREHGEHVRRLALELFHDLAPLHGLDGVWENRLATAAQLHDIGLVSGRKGHHKAGKRMIEEDNALSLDPDERLLVALLVRYHRKAWPSPKHKSFAKLAPESRKGLRRATALLRIADALDYEHTGRIAHVKTEVKTNRVELTVECREDCSVEMARVQEKGALFVHLFQRELHFQCQTE